MTRRRLLTRLVAAAASTLVVAVVLLGLDHRAFESLLDQTYYNERTSESFKAAILDLAASPPAGVATPDKVDRLRAQGAQTLALGLEQEQELRDVQLWPWDRDGRRARSRYLAHQVAWNKEFRAASKGQLGDVGPEIQATFNLAREAYFEAVPWFDNGDQKRRVARMFAS